MKTPFTAISKKSGKTFFLHEQRQPVLRAGARVVTLYYFAGKPGENAIDALPDGYEVGENSRTGLPILRRIK